MESPGRVVEILVEAELFEQIERHFVAMRIVDGEDDNFIVRNDSINIK